MKYLITGGAGFIGCNFAEKLLQAGSEVVILDDLSRKGAAMNLKVLRTKYKNLRFVKADISKDLPVLMRECAVADVIFHLAAQVGVSSSVIDPRRDFEINAIGTLNILEAVRLSAKQPMLLYASTNKVYGALDQVPIYEASFCYRFKNQTSIAETQSLDFHSPYGCSKGTGEQYVRDYARIYGLRTVVFRQSCIYGPGQFGTEDQGWVAWFAIAAMLGLPITFYGNGKQTRDILYIDDLYQAWVAAVDKIDQVSGTIFNIGGGYRQALSLRQLIERLRQVFGSTITVYHDEWRPGDQCIYISDNSLAEESLSWKPQVGINEGTTKLFNWIREREGFFRKLFAEQIVASKGKLVA